MFPNNLQNLSPGRTARFWEIYRKLSFYELHGRKHCACVTLRGKRCSRGRASGLPLIPIRSLHGLLQRGNRHFFFLYYCKEKYTYQWNKLVFPRSAAIVSAVSTSSSLSLSLVMWLTSLLFFSSGEIGSEEDDMGLSVLFGGIKLQGLTRQMAEHQKDRPYPLTIPSPILLGKPFSSVVMLGSSWYFSL